VRGTRQRLNGQSGAQKVPRKQKGEKDQTGSDHIKVVDVRLNLAAQVQPVLRPVRGRDQRSTPGGYFFVHGREKRGN